MESIATPALWSLTVGGIVVLLAVDFAITRRPHDVSMREAARWTAFYIVLAVAFGGYVWAAFGAARGLEYLTGYLVEKSLSVDNLFVFMLLLGAFAVPRELQQRALLYGIVGALVLRALFIAVGAAAMSLFDWTFLVFGLILVLTAVRILKGAVLGRGHEADATRVPSVRLLRRVVPVTSSYRGAALTARLDGHRAVTPFALAVVAILFTDVVFAVDSIPAVYGITGDPYLVFVTNAFALLGLRALYFVLHGALNRLVYLDYGLALILVFIGVKLALHWGHLHWPAVPEIPSVLSLLVIITVLAGTTAASLVSARRPAGRIGENPPAVRAGRR